MLSPVEEAYRKGVFDTKKILRSEIAKMQDAQRVTFERQRDLLIRKLWKLVRQMDKLTEGNGNG